MIVLRAPLPVGEISKLVADHGMLCPFAVELLRPGRRTIEPTMQRSVVDLRFDFVVRCPRCLHSPDSDARWQCSCGFVWSPFDTWGRCPACQRDHDETQCRACNEWSAHRAWYEPTGV